MLVAEVGWGSDAVVGLSALAGCCSFVTWDNDRPFNALTFDDEKSGCFFRVEQLVCVFEGGYFLAVNRLDSGADVAADMCVDGVTENTGEDDDVFAFFENSFIEIVGEETAHASV